jgi:hypothetical protein
MTAWWPGFRAQRAKDFRGVLGVLGGSTFRMQDEINRQERQEGKRGTRGEIRRTAAAIQVFATSG